MLVEGDDMEKEVSCGALIYRYEKGVREYLLIQHVNGTHYGFPKGHIEHNEKRKETALREIKEETNLNVYIVGNYYKKVTYSPKHNVIKDVIYYIAKVMDGNIQKQDSEIIQILWCSFDEAMNLLNYENDKNILKDTNKKIDFIEKGIDPLLMSHVEKNILPVYQKFDDAHHVDHIYDVIYDALKIANDFDVNHSMIYAISAYHDIGLQFGRETHHITSGELLEKDEVINKIFKLNEIQIMKEAIFDHRASSNHKPRTIYGLVLAEADRQLDAQDIIYRTALYEKSKHPSLSLNDQIENCYEHMLEKYSEKGYMKLWLSFNKHEKELSKLRHLIRQPKKIKRIFKKYLSLN
jgi:uncharacterized protein